MLLGRLATEALMRTKLKMPREVQRYVTTHGLRAKRNHSTPEPFLLHRPDERFQPRPSRLAGQLLGSGTSSEEASVATCFSGRLCRVDPLEAP